MLKTKNVLSKKNRSNRTDPSHIGSVWFGSDDFLKVIHPNQTEPHVSLSRG
jgi:hypothetical protein